MRRLLPLTLLLLLAVPAAASAKCPANVGFKGSLRQADFSGGGGPLGKRSLKVGEKVTGRTIQVGESYYVPKGKSARLRLHGYTQRAAAGTVFIAQCDIWTGKDLYFRLLEGKVKVSGKAVKAGAQGSPPGSYVVTPEATLLPMPGRASFTATRVVKSTRSATRTSVQAARGAGNIWVTISSLAAAGKKIPCQAGGKVTVFGNGKYRNG